MGWRAYDGYYVTHDLEQGTMSFVPHSDSKKPPIERGSIP